jgi:hypothetical protein
MMFGLSNERLKELKEKYPVGTRVKCISMPQEPHPVPRGTIGTVTGVDDLGTIHVHWDNHSALGLVIDVDKFEIVDQK